MFSFLSPPIPRSKTAHLNPFVTGSETAKSSAEFLPLVRMENSPTATLAVRQFISPDPKNVLGNPPYHWHAWQTETFTVEQGVMKATLEGIEKDVPAGQSIEIHPGEYHTFANASTVDPLQVLISLNVEEGKDKADEEFFRNIYSYLDDCEKHKKGPSPFQMLLFLTSADTYLALPIPFIPRVIQRGISRMVGFFGGVVVGEWLLGYRRSYPEYIDGVELEDMKEK